VTAVTELPVPKRLQEHYLDRGIERLYPPQSAAIETGLLDGASLVASVPTASGKTLLAELAMGTTSGTALYIVPLRALAREKGETFGALPDVEVVVATGDLGAQDPDFDSADVVVATSEKVDSLLRSRAGVFRDLTCVVVDEIHLVNQSDRGPTLEMVVSNLRRQTDDIQVLGLSATVGNPTALATWIDARLVESEWRPVELKRGVYRTGTIRFQDDSTRHVATVEDGSPCLELIKDTFESEGQVLVFVHSRRAAEDLARSVGNANWSDSVQVAEDVRQTAKTGTGRALAESLAGGGGFHHAGLRPKHRRVLESAFRRGELRVVCATPTLAAGVNLPARRVVVRDTRRYTDQGWTDLSVLEVHQMFGRAGRPGMDPYGEAVVIADDTETAERLRDRYLMGEPENLSSSLATQDALRTHILASVASGVADSRGDLIEILEGTFYAVEEDSGVLVDVADLVLDDLVGLEMLERATGRLGATRLGTVVSRQYVEPRTGARYREAVDSLESWSELSRLTLLEVVCRAGDVPSPSHHGGDQADAHRFAVRNESELLVDLDAFDGDYASWLETLGAVRILSDLLNGADEATVTERYGIGPGDVRAITERAAWLTGALAAIAGVRDSSHESSIDELATELADTQAAEV
jgi:helicase